MIGRPLRSASLGFMLIWAPLVAGCTAGPDPCEELACTYGSCAVAITAPTCSCDQGYAGRRCDECAVGFHPLSDGACAADEHCTEASCSAHATCDDQTGSPVCTCETGYAGRRCEGCAAGHYRHHPSGSCKPFECEDNSIRSDAMVDFDSWDDFPSSPDSCGASLWLRHDDLTMLSIEGDGYVWSCAPSTIYRLETQHVILDAGKLGPAQLSLAGQVSHLGFDYAAYSALAVTLFADGVEVGALGAEEGAVGRLDFDFVAPISLFEIRSERFTNQIAIDDLEYAPPPCP